MTAVASPPSFQPLPRWNTGNGGQRGLDPMSADEVTRMFMDRKSAQRTNSSSSVASSSSGSSTYTIPAAPSQTNVENPVANGDQGGWGPRLKPAKRIWTSSKSEPVSGLSTTRPISVPTTSSGQSAASTMTAMHQPSPIVPSTNRLQSQPQQNGGRVEPPNNQAEPPVVLALLPMTGTFERKQITVPYFPEVLRIGRQTNAKTVPTPINGYFDSKVLSRQHAEVWADRNGKVWIRDVKSSNGTFVNGVRLSPENRDSEPHELREHDTLELGIDIVSEDQKSIVHHKVSAKVELAGIYGNSSNVLDLNFGEIDPNAGNGLLGPSMGQPMSQMRGRGAGQGSIGSNARLSGPPSMINASLNAMGPQRQMNYWMNPVTIEQVVKKLTAELKQAKQQSQDLHRTGDFFSMLLTSGSSEELPKAPCDIPVEDLQPSIVSPAAQLDAISPFSQPPVPPPQQPLPEKPDIARFSISDSISPSSLKRTETERPGSLVNSPVKPDPPSSQILSLIEELTTAKREIGLQGDRMKHLEILLQNERKARESAEERARCLLEGHNPHGTQKIGGIDETPGPSLDSPKKMESLVTNGCDTHHEENNISHSIRASARSTDPAQNAEESHDAVEPVGAETSRLQERLELMIREMDEMKALMESYKHRAEGAEQERKGLAEIVEQIRADEVLRSQTSSAAPTIVKNSHASPSKLSLSSRPGSSLDRKILEIPGTATTSSIQQDGARDAASPEDSNKAQDVKDQRNTPSTTLERQRDRRVGGSGDVALQSAPFISMVGVVLIGVGIMTWLNGWPKGER